jgi:hypothetical protein
LASDQVIPHSAWACARCSMYKAKLQEAVDENAKWVHACTVIHQKYLEEHARGEELLKELNRLSQRNQT